MATLTLTALWINLLADGTSFSGYTEPSRKRRAGKEGEVRTYAGGRRRSFTTEGLASGFDFTLVNLTLAQCVALEAWIGQAVQVRDHRGQRHYGVYFDVAVDEYRDGLYTAAISLQGITVDEG